MTHYQTLPPPPPTSQHSSNKDQKEIMFQQFTTIKNPGQKYPLDKVPFNNK